MLTEQHDTREGRRVWLDESEVELLIDEADRQQHRIAFELGARCGLRSHEILDVAPTDLLDTDAGRMLRVPEGKGDKYRETPIPGGLARAIEAVGASRNRPKTDPIIEVTTTRSLRGWIERYRKELAAEEEDERWRFLTTHDLRRTWAGHLANRDVDQQVALLWGGWNDLDTFLEHYRGEATARAQRREREKIEWL